MGLLEGLLTGQNNNNAVRQKNKGRQMRQQEIMLFNLPDQKDKVFTEFVQKGTNSGLSIFS